MRRKFTELVDFIKTRPYLIIEGICSVSILLFGVFLITPLYGQETASASSAGTYIVGTNIGKFIFLASCIVPPFLTLVGAIWKPLSERSQKIRAWGMLGVFYGYFFVTLLWIIVAGLVPLVWVFTFALSLIAAVVYLRIKWELHNS